MSTDRTMITSKTNEDVLLTQFFGGFDRGPCVQLTQRNGHSSDPLHSVTITIDQAKELNKQLRQWIKEMTPGTVTNRIHHP